MDGSAIEVSAASIQAIVARHGLGTRRSSRLASAGGFTSVYRLDDSFVLRVAHADPAAIAGLLSDRVAIPAARAAGVRTPRLIALDDTCELLPVPYGVYERVPGEPRSALALPAAATPALWRELGADLARLHHGVAADGPAAQLARHDTEIDPRPWLAELHAQQIVTAEAAGWLGGWLDQLERFARATQPVRLCHGDVNASNIIANPTTHGYLALIDWGGVGWGDPTWDFVPVSLQAVPLMLAGYRAVAALDGDETAEARLLWHHLQFVIYGLHKARRQGAAWAAERLARLQRDLDAFLDQPTTGWIAALR